MSPINKNLESDTLLVVVFHPSQFTLMYF